MWFIISIMAIGVIVVPGITLAKKLYDRKNASTVVLFRP